MINKRILEITGFLFIGFILIATSVLAINDAKSEINSIEIYNSNIFNLPGAATGGSNIDEATNVKITKQIMPSDKKNSPDIKLTLEMPPKPANLDIVLAMDTSGSMVQNYQENYPSTTFLNWSSKAITPIIKKYPKARVSIVSWDDEDESGDTITPFYNATKDSLTIQNELNRLALECFETDTTVYSIGVKRAVQVLDDNNNKPTDPFNTARIIIFITGLSEFRAEPKNASNNLTLDYQLANAKRNRTYGLGTNFSGYQIYPVQIGIDRRFKLQYSNLSKISKETSIVGQPVLDEPINISDIEKLDSAIESILKRLETKPVAHDVQVIDTLYPYLNYLGSENILDSGNNKQIPAIQTGNSSDGSTTLSWDIGTMNGSDMWTALIHTQLILNLPVEVSSNNTELRYEITNATPISEARYTWMTGYKGVLSLPEGNVAI